MFAAYKGHTEIVSLLLDYGANIYARAKNGWTAKRAAESGNKSHIIEMIKSAETGELYYIR
jgi:ankyrin repeat protein